VKLFSPAKLNLFFRVLHKRDDGFHEIASLMQAISLGDTLTFEENSHELLTTSDPHLSCDESNTITQALRLFQKKTGYLKSLRIHVEKQTPMEGGLGGGSSNVATTLWALNTLSGLAIEEETLRKWAGEISSDAPFFFSSGTAFTTGRGEIVENMSPLKSRTLWLAKPEGKGLSTPLVYQHCHPNVHNIAPRLMLERFIFLNDLEMPAFKLRPDLEQLKEDLIKLGFETVVMTGSGTTFFCLGDIDPHLPGIQFIKTRFLSRTSDWYRLK
jgi:4-diphosphocytidyl-2-C-methyl-D-erythritol kinase